ncbi:D-alanyl-D-alanine carboxypeptidase/D-alanyl-D-alanine-endopeptidase [Bacteroides sp. GD17]|jgi:D-alanyl-D-alanine carboxypeptidase/D-alanyl-D-alanine-endopeptidase (penicillin-binding protein 4)|uniref:D-alanyl-D-alanine carboxypeptidase/D-alanyl-D-alanine endopeptidase n=1 Tax=Bacteroides sp. GD17 TaxID=3139826 RepID=UPI0025CE1770|nr:D-alanyl-D-alanine carboxypeptidase/D-alanyl-D-alanine-endopeptidase [uncultured Bacteroides sp.]
MNRILLYLLLSVCCLPLSAQEAGNGANTLSSRLDTLIKYKLPQGSNVAISVYDLTAKEPLYTYQADKLSRPASTMKLLTTITALSRPEADEPFRTEVWYKGAIENDTLRGDVYVIGGFDPEFDDSALDSLADALARLPFTVIRGKVYGDVSMKDSLYWGSGWAWDDTPYSYQPYLSPLMLNKGVVTVTATPGERGEEARLAATPASSYYTLTNQTASRTPSAGRFRVSRNWLTNGNNILVTGNVDGRRAGTVNIYSSQDFFMRTLMDRLQARGIHCIADSCSSGDYAFDEFLQDSTSVQVAVYETDVQAVVKQIMKESDNLNAEAMLCRLGAQTTGKKRISAEDGLTAIRALIKQLGHNPDHYNLADGCGLSNYNYISPELLVSFLKYAYSRTDVFQKLYKALPIGGIDGTLQYRMAKGTPSYRNVHAKTGSFTAINCLAGYLKAGNGHQIAFAIMNQSVLSGREARAFQDAVCDEVIKTK